MDDKTIEVARADILATEDLLERAFKLSGLSQLRKLKEEISDAAS